MEDSTDVKSEEINKLLELLKDINARNAFRLVSDAIRKLVHGKHGHEIEAPGGKQVVYEDGSSYFLGVDSDGTFTLRYSCEKSETISQLRYYLYRNGSQIVEKVSHGKTGQVSFSLDGSKQNEKLD